MASSTETMRTWQYSAATGGLEKSLQLVASAPVPAVGRGDVLVRVRAVSLNPADHKLPELGLLARAMVSVPATPCMDLAGTVERVGEDVTSFRAGDRVAARIPPQQHGALSELVAVPAPTSPAGSSASGGGANLVRLPDAVSFADGACLGTAGMTALQAVAPHVRPDAGDRVFVNGGSGGVGIFTVQIARALGCRVTASCSAGAGADLVRSLGADEIIDYRTQDVAATLRQEVRADGGQQDGQGLFRLVVDNVGVPADLYKAADDFLLPSGQFIQVGGGASLSDIRTMSSRMLLPSFLGGGKRSFQFILTKSSQADLERVAAWVAEGKVKVVIDETFAFEDVPKAFAKLKTGRAKGKIVVTVSPE